MAVDPDTAAPRCGDRASRGSPGREYLVLPPVSMPADPGEPAGLTVCELKVIAVLTRGLTHDVDVTGGPGADGSGVSRCWSRASSGNALGPDMDERGHRSGPLAAQVR